MQLLVFIFAYRLQPFVRGVFARNLEGEVGKPAVFGSTMPVFHVGRNVDNSTWHYLLCRLAFFLIPPTTTHTYQHLAAACCGMVYMPVVAASRLKGYIGKRYLTRGDAGKITITFEVSSVGCVRLADGKYHLTLESGLGVIAGYVFVPHLFGKIEGSPSLGPTGIESDMCDYLGYFCTCDAVVLGSL